MAKIIIRVPEPCHEDWAGMTAAEQGRFCGSCKKIVTDFSAMSDEELFAVLKRGSSGCGRFTDEQLNRFLAGPAPAARKQGWAMILSFLLPLGIWKSGQAQENGSSLTSKTEQIATSNRIEKSETPVLSIRGRITDAAGIPIPDVAVIVVGTRIGVVSDSAGYYSLSVPASDSILLEASHISFTKSVERITNINGGKAHTRDFKLQPASQTLGEVAVICAPATKKGRFRLGGFIAVQYSAGREIVDTIRQSLRPIFKIYPNPAARGSVVTVHIPRAGYYSARLFDMQSRLVLEYNITATKGQPNHALDLPAGLTAGAYQLVLTSDTGKQHSSGLIIR